MRKETRAETVASLDPTYAGLALEDAGDREQVFEVLLRAARSLCEVAALLSVHNDHVRGRRALAADGFDVQHVGELRVARGAAPAFEQAIASAQPSVGSLATGDLFVDGLLEQIGGATQAAVVLPLAIGKRVVALIVAHRGDAPLALADVNDLFPLLPASAVALARILAARPKVAPAPAPAPAPRAETAYDVEIVAPKIDELRAKGAWEELAAALRERIEHGMEHGDPDEDEQLELLLELGQLEAERLAAPERAIAAWQTAQTIDASDVRVLDALEALYVAQGRWSDRGELLEKRIALADTPKQRIPLLLELAALARERLDDDERAVAAYERILHWEPQQPTATRELESIYQAREQWEPLAALLLDRVSQDPAQGIAELEAVARMYEDKVGDLRAAFLVWLAVIRRDPDRVEHVEQLARLGAQADAWDEILAEGAALAEELETQHAQTAARVWHLVGTWRRDQHREDAAYAFERAVRLAPTDSSAVLAYDAILRAQGRWIDLAALLLQRAEVERDTHRRGELLAELGDLYENYLGQADDALACYERARADDPAGRPVLGALRRLYRAKHDWAALDEVLRAMIELYDPASERGELVDLHVEHAGVLNEQLGRPEDAVRELRAALELEPQHPPAFRALATVYQATGQTDALLDATEDAVDAAPRAEQLERYAEVARGWYERGRFDRAAACWQKLIDLDPKRLAAHEGFGAALRADEQWTALAGALRARLEIASDKPAVLLELAEVLDTHLDDTEAAIAAYDGVLAADPKHRGALDAIARLHDRAGRLPPAIAALQKLLELTKEPAARGEVFQRLGHAYLNARDVAAARLHLEQALALDLGNAGAHEGMARAHLLQDEAVAGGEELVRAAELSVDPGDKIRRLADAAWVFRHRLHDAERARQCLHLILELDPEHPDAKLALAELLHDSKRWEELWPHLEEEVARADADASLPDRADVYSRAARCALELDRFTAALALYDKACALDTSPALQIERAEALVRSKSLDAAAAALQTIVLRHQSSLERAQLVGVYRRLAELHATLGKPSQAQLFHQKVLELEPRDAITLRALSDLHAGRGRYDEAIASLRTLADSLEPAERVPLLERIGDLYRDKLKNAPRAMSTYVEALEHAPGNHRLLQRMLDLQTEGGQWKSALETIEKFLAHEADPVRRGAYYIASAEIRRNELRDKPGALDAYERALDELFAQPNDAARTRGLETFRIVDEMLTAERNWTAQEKTYRRMIKRVAPGDPALVALWHALGEIYRTRLRQQQSAIEAFEVAHSLDPGKAPERASILAELYALIGKQRPAEVPQRAAKLVETAPTNPDAYRALGQTIAKTSTNVDEAWCVARALVVLKKASADEAALYKRYQSHEVRKATGILDEEAWKHVRHPEEDRAISGVFSVVWEGAVALRAGPAKAFEIKTKERLPVEDGTRVLAKIFRHAARVLNVGLPDVYVQPRRPGRLLLANCIERGRLVPAVIVGRDLMTGYRDTEIAASVGAMLALLRPAYYLKLALPSVEELEAALGAAAQLVGHAWTGRAELEPLRTAFATEMKKRLDRRRAEALIALVQRLPEQPDLARWREAVDAAAQRAGLLVSGELAAAARMLSTEASALGGPRPGQRVQDLVSYSVSPSYFAVRRDLGVTVG